MVRSMIQGNPIKLILEFTIPLLIGNVFQQFYNIADIIIVGRVIGVNALAAVGATGPVFMAMLGLTIGMASGFTVVVGQRFGAGDEAGVRRSVAMSAILSIGMTLILTGLTAFCMPQIMAVMNISSELYEDAYHYVIIISYGLLAMMMYNLLSCICRALGDSRTPLYFLIMSSILNVCLALLFIMGFGWGVPGSAIALVIAQAISAIACFYYMWVHFPILHLHRSDWVWNKAFAWQHLRIGIPMAAQFMIISLGILAIQSVTNTFGSETIAGFVSATRIEQLAMQPMISFGIAMAVYSAQNFGAGKYDRIRKGARQCSAVSFAFCAVSAAAMFFYGRELIAVFTAEYDEFLVEQAMLYLKMSVPFYFFLGQIFIFRNALQGMGISSVPLISGLLELSLRGLSAFVLAGMWGYVGICCASPICWLAACFFTTGCYFFVMRNMKRTGR
ncbi:MAG: MATE family efflux transporter [Megasphaera sp.]|nr:MATE family efflux transporter [Megasphaera sp.]